MTITPLPQQFPAGTSSNWNNQYQSCSLTPQSGTFAGTTISFPVSQVEMEWSNDVAQHKKPYVAGAKVEGTGFNPLIFKVHALFINGMIKGPNDTWGSDLFPLIYSQVISILTDPVVPIIQFVHPVLQSLQPITGQFIVKSMGGHTITSVDCYNGQEMDFEIVQCNLDTQTLVQKNSNGVGQAAAAAFDSANIVNFNITKPINNSKTNSSGVSIPPPAPGYTTLSQLFNSVIGVIDSTTLSFQQIGFIVNNANYMINRMNASLESLKQANTSVFQMNLARTQSAINASFNQKRIQLITLKQFKLPQNMTLAQVASLLQNSIEQLIDLNPNITANITLAAGTLVLYNGS